MTIVCKKYIMPLKRMDIYDFIPRISSTSRHYKKQFQALTSAIAAITNSGKYTGRVFRRFKFVGCLLMFKYTLNIRS
jgi:hypothetical protein